MKSFREEEDESIDQNDVKVDLDGWADHGRSPSTPYSETPAVRMGRGDMDAQAFPSRKRDGDSPV
ncbi:hypothetical protein FRC00_014528 [Tulasnella sp. 408]|nr:hypothetical protein FRC00_014528 [Tulasnella sp. 408]